MLSKGDIVIQNNKKNPYPFKYGKNYIATFGKVYCVEPLIIALDGFHYTSKIKQTDIKFASC